MGSQLQAAAYRNYNLPKAVWNILLLTLVLTQVLPQGEASWSEGPQGVTGNWVKESTNSKFVQKYHTTSADSTQPMPLKGKRHYGVNHYPVLSLSAGCNIHVHSEGETMVQLQDNNMMYAMSPDDNMMHAMSPDDNMMHAMSPDDNMMHAMSPDDNMMHAMSPDDNMMHAMSPMTSQKWHKPLECSDVLCLVQGLLAREPQIILLDDINASESLPLPEVFGKTTIIGACGGDPCMIDGGGMGQIFVVGMGGMLTLKDLEITGGACNEGSAVLVSGNVNSRRTGGRLLALNVLFHNNTASGNGGAVMVKAGGLAHIRSCIFEDNMASKGAALYIGSVQEYPMVPLGRKCGLNTCVTVVNTAFWRNQASWGGAIYVDDAPLQCSRDGGAKFECTTCSFVNNTAWVDGGAILLAYVSSGAIGHVKMTTFHNNTAMKSGGDVELQAGRRLTHGVEFDAYMTEFSGTDATGDRAVAVKDFAIANFVKCKEQDDSAIFCGGRTCGFCPNKQYQYSMPPSSNLFLNDSSNGEICPSPPPALCNWIPSECLISPPPPSPPPPSPPPPSPPPPSPPPPSPPPPSPPPPFSPPPPPPSPPPPSPPPPMLAPVPTPMLESPPPPIFIKKYQPPPPDFKSESAPTAPPPPTMCECKCPPPKKGYVEGDPHFFGKHGERFDFHGKNNHNYCVISDTKLQINMHVFQGIHQGSSFISMIGLTYQNYNILINVQPNLNESYPNPKKSVVQINKEDLPKGHEYISTNNRMTISYYPTYIRVRIPNTIDFNVTIMKPTFGIHGSGANYVNFQVAELKVSPMVHGILGQTYQETKEVYMKLHNAHAHRMTPSQATKVYIDGNEDDYITSGIFAADCKFCKFEDQKPFPANMKRALMTKAKRMLSSENGEELVSGCAGIGDPTALCVDLIDNWFN